MPDARAALASQDPTGTKTKREDAITSLNSRWQRVRGRIRRLLENSPTLKPSSDARQSVKIADFEDELEAIINEEVINPVRSRDARRGRHYSSQWVDEAYRHGLDLADEHLKRAGYDPPPRSTDAAIRDDLHRDAIQAQRLRTYDDIEEAGRNAQQDASRRYSEAIGTGIALSTLIRNKSSSSPENDGVNDRIKKKGQTGTKRALTWHYIESVNDASLNRYAEAGVEDVTSAVETDGGFEVGIDVDETSNDPALDIQTAQDPRVCSECLMLAAGGPYPLEDVRQDPNLRPPFHFECRCHAIPTSLQERTNLIHRPLS